MTKNKTKTMEILKFTVPMILSALSVSLMIIIDRLVLTRYSIEAVNAVTLAGFFVSVSVFMWISVAQIATVFVGQYNGKGEFKKTGRPVWQMIYLALFAACIFIPSSFFVEKFCFIPESFRSEGIPYQRIFMMFAPLQIVFVALSTFFIGRKQSNIIVVSVFLGNIVNFFLDVALVFGVQGVVTPLGTVGAAIASASSQFFQVVILMFLFLKQKYRDDFGTLDFKFRKSLFWGCLKVGIPFSFGKLLNMIAWYLVLLFFSYSSNLLATIISAEFMVLVIFTFFANGMEGAVSSMVSNLIGQNDFGGVVSLLKTLIGFNIMVAAVFSIPLLFLNDIVFYMLNLPIDVSSEFYPQFCFILKATFVIVVAEGFFYTFVGVLSAGGDTKYPMCLEIISSWVGAVLPTAILYVSGKLNDVYIAYSIIPFSYVLNCVFVYLRYKKAFWYKQLV